MLWTAASPRRASRQTYRPALENLEDRTVPAAVLPGRPGVFDPNSATWYLRSTVNGGAPDAGQFGYGWKGAVPVVGDWNHDGHDDIGVFDSQTANWYLHTGANGGAADAGTFNFGGAGWIPVVGDWTGTGHVGIGAVDPATGTWYLRNSVSGGAPDLTFRYGGWQGGVPVVGNWNGGTKTGIGYFDSNTGNWYLRSTASGGAADVGIFGYGWKGAVPVVGDWTGAGHDSVGVFDPNTAKWYLHNGASGGAADAGVFQYGGAGWKPVVGNFQSLAPQLGDPVLSLNLNPLDINLLGLEVQTNQIQVNVSALPGQGKLLGNLLTTVSHLINLQGVNAALNNVLGSVVQLLNSTSLNVSGVNTGGSLGTATPATTPVLDLFVAPVHLDLLGALVDTSPIHLTITAHSGNGLVLGNVVADLANLFNPPLPAQLNLDDVNARLVNLLGQLNAQAPGIGTSPSSTPTPPAGQEQIVSLTLAPINLNLLGLLLQTSQIQVNVNAQTGNGQLLGNVLTTLLNTLGATPQNLTDLSNNLNGLLGKVIGILNVATLTLPAGAVDSLSHVLQTLALPDLVNNTGTTATAPILNLAIASVDGTSPPVDVNLLGLVVTTSNINAQLVAQTGDGQVLGNLLYNVANLLNPGGTLNLLTILNELSL